MRDDGLLFGYFETPESFQAALDGMAAEEINAKWQEFMTPYFEDLGGGMTRMTDRIDFASPVGVFGRCVDAVYLSGYLRRLIAERGRAIKAEAERACDA